MVANKYLKKCEGSKFLEKCDSSKYLKSCEEFDSGCWRVYTVTFIVHPDFGCQNGAPDCSSAPGLKEMSFTVTSEPDLDVDVQYSAYGTVGLCERDGTFPWHLVETPTWTLVYEDFFIKSWLVAFKDDHGETCPNGPDIRADPICSTISPHDFPEPGPTDQRGTGCPPTWPFTLGTCH